MRQTIIGCSLLEPWRQLGCLAPWWAPHATARHPGCRGEPCRRCNCYAFTTAATPTGCELSPVSPKLS